MLFQSEALNCFVMAAAFGICLFVVKKVQRAKARAQLRPRSEPKADRALPGMSQQLDGFDGAVKSAASQRVIDMPARVPWNDVVSVAI